MSMLKMTIMSGATACLLTFGPVHAGWLIQESGTTKDLYGVTFNHGSDDMVWACGEGGTILHSSDGGSTWLTQHSGTTANLYAVTFIEAAGAPVFVVGDSGIILHTTDLGATWVRRVSGTTQALRDFSDFGFSVVGDSGIVLQSTDGGLSWMRRVSPTTARLNAVCATFGKYAIGDNGTILKSTDQGVTWYQLASGTARHLYGVPLFGAIDLIVGDSGLVYRSTNFGTSWYAQATGVTEPIYSAEYSVNNTSRIFCVGGHGTILRTTDYGSTWGVQTTPTLVALRSVFFYLNDQIGYAVGDGGIILKTTDGGGPVTSIAMRHSRAFRLGPNFPNPFNPATTITFELQDERRIELRVYNVLGEEVAWLAGGRRGAGTHRMVWDGRNDKGRAVPAGIYFYRLSDGVWSETRKMVLLK